MTLTLLAVDFTPISLPDYERWVLAAKKSRFVVTLVARTLKAVAIGKGVLVFLLHESFHKSIRAYVTGLCC